MSLQITFENAFDIAEAIHCYASVNHSGQCSDLYQILSESDFRPGALWSETRCMAENPYYDQINESNIYDLFNELQSTYRSL